MHLGAPWSRTTEILPTCRNLQLTATHANISIGRASFFYGKINVPFILCWNVLDTRHSISILPWALPIESREQGAILSNGSPSRYHRTSTSSAGCPVMTSQLRVTSPRSASLTSLGVRLRLTSGGTGGKWRDGVTWVCLLHDIYGLLFMRIAQLDIGSK